MIIDKKYYCKPSYFKAIFALVVYIINKTKGRY